MEDVLETYAKGVRSAASVLWMDEHPFSCQGDAGADRRDKTAWQACRLRIRTPMAQPAFSCCRTVIGFPASDRSRTADEKPTGRAKLRKMLDTRSTDGEEVTLVCDHLNTHTKGAFYEAFEPDRARAYLKRIHFCYTPQHGSWLHVAACELSCVTSQCLSDRRIVHCP